MAEWFAELALRLVFEVACAGTGHAVLWAATAGRWRPFEGERDTEAALLGVAVWLVAGGAACRALGILP